MKAKLHFVLSLSIFLSVFYATAQQGYWQKTNKTNSTDIGKQITLNQKFYQTYQLNIDAFKVEVANAPLRSVTAAKSNTKVYLPNVKGELEQFRVVESPVLSKALAKRYPNIKTYLGFSTENLGVRARFSITPQGLQSMITYPDAPMSFAVPQSKANKSSYIVYSREARIENIKHFECLTEGEFSPMNTNSFTNKDANDQVLRTFRMAISTTAEYTNFWDDGNAANGNAQEDALAQVVSTLNRSNEVYEVDMAINFTLVSGTEIIFTDPDNDPYSINDNFNGEVQSTLTGTIGEANYDLGHLFHLEDIAEDNDGNAACIGCVCVDGQKGSAFSSHAFTDNDGGAYMSDFFDIDYVPHEIGHQLGANHTWSFRSESTSVQSEPGSGSTIMGYAGITGSNDVQDHADPYFHYHSIRQILNNLNTRTCWVGTAITNNNPPVADAGNDFTIPIGTAFVLRGAATDGDTEDILTYTWEQTDSGVTTVSSFGPDEVNGPVWRSRPPSTSTDRFMPIIERVVAGQLTEVFPEETSNNTSWETVSNVTRSLNFALTVRDRSEVDGINQSPQSSFDTMLVTVDDSAGPFIVTSQDTNETWNAGSRQTITWDVAGTDVGAVNTPTVNILLSTDGGFTYPFIMASNVANDGSAEVTVPNIDRDTAFARVKVVGNNNIFYAINAVNFSVLESLSMSDGSINNFQIFPNPSNGSFRLKGSFTANGLLEVNIFDLRGRLVYQNKFNSTQEFNEEIKLEGVSTGLYILTLSDGAKTASKKIIIQ